MSGDSPTVTYWHLYADADGITHQHRCTMSEFQMKSIGSGASPQWQGRTHHDGASVMVTVLPVGWQGDWHENPKPQWIIPLSGRWYVEAMDGTRVEMGPGEISFGEDQGAAEQDGRKGHTSGTVGDEPAVLMLVQFDTPREATKSCPFQ
ncbi:cupin domain-containing protein [Acuticoccus sp. MNP-M23]|uniref:cupin domain-containing protein n=1 Tax=Acuticoccus sp. MNP-M23 TaxID=3072793 RepID=UPI00281590FE|nr:cupin domain-containing protein [Acuticoccus sp. MNP-M23]WMS41930.1 cupin domain-containing protein [Acuticoccus sp. MNP-M23]